jgi:phosphatidate cytidylyltransferase
VCISAALTRLLLDLFALLYIVNGFGHAILLRYGSGEYGLGLQILGLCCAWVCDSGALVAGSFMGHAKLAPVVSPGKTLVGAIAGILSSIATVLVVFALPQFSNALPWTHELLPAQDVVPLTHQVVLGAVLGVLCIVGDLAESYVKRVAGVKDSGAFFPGHGGCLDRMDSFLFVAPCLYYYSQFALPR